MKSVSKNFSEIHDLADFLADNECSEEAQEFGEMAAIALANEGEVDYEELIIKAEDFLNNLCLNGVYNDLDASNVASDFLSNFQGQTPVAHLELTVGVDPSFPDANAVTYDPENFIIEIMFNPNNLDRPRTSVARTFMHEIIHAEMFRKLLSLAQQGSIPWSESFIKSIKNDFPENRHHYKTKQIQLLRQPMQFF